MSWSKILVILAWPSLAGAQSLEPPSPYNESRILAEDVTEPRRPLEIQFTSELRHLSTKIIQRRGEEGTELHELSGMFRYEPDPHLGFTLDAGVEQFDSESEFLFRTAEVDYRPQKWIEARVGQSFIPLGFFTEHDRWMAELPHYYKTLLPWEKGIDFGARGIVRPFSNDLLMLDGSIYSGRSFRPGDERPGPAEVRPRLLQLRSQHSNFHMFASLWEHDLAFRDKIQARGLGFSLRHGFQGIDLEPALWAEYFAIEEQQPVGPLQESHVGTAVVQLRWRRLTLGTLWAHSQQKVLINDEKFSLDSITERNTFAEIQVHKNFSLRTERRSMEESQKTVDDTVVRALFEVEAL